MDSLEFHGYNADFNIFNLNSGIYIVVNNNIAFSIFEVYSLPKLNYYVIINRLIHTPSNFEIAIHFIRQKWSRRKNLDGVQITAIATV